MLRLLPTLPSCTVLSTINILMPGSPGSFSVCGQHPSWADGHFYFSLFLLFSSVFFFSLILYETRENDHGRSRFLTRAIHDTFFFFFSKFWTTTTKLRAGVSSFFLLLLRRPVWQWINLLWKAIYASLRHVINTENTHPSIPSASSAVWWKHNEPWRNK